MREGFVIWLTGLPASGKTTIAGVLTERLRSRSVEVEVLDGDEVRRSLSADLGFSAEDRRRHNRRVIYVSKLLMRHGVVVIVPIISPQKEIRDLARNELRRFVEVYVKCGLGECIRRDPKGLYDKAILGELEHFTGISDPYEEPDYPEVTVETDVLPVEGCVERILGVVSELGYLVAAGRNGRRLVEDRAYRKEAGRVR